MKKRANNHMSCVDTWVFLGLSQLNWKGMLITLSIIWHANNAPIVPIVYIAIKTVRRNSMYSRISRIPGFIPAQIRALRFAWLHRHLPYMSRSNRQQFNQYAVDPSCPLCGTAVPARSSNYLCNYRLYKLLNRPFPEEPTMSTDFDKWIDRGERLGLKDKELQKFVRQQPG